ncbi:MAG TPA: insulinase family protein [Pyrinomonadaceae bacterium]|nr:insulinase family protein [Pyrinomonadaceae bacterium]
MKFRSRFNKFFPIVLCLILGTTASFAQKPAGGAPRQEKLLNGLKVLMWSDPAASDVKVSIRVHSGAAFDPQGKEGVMKLLAENIFPTAASRSYFADDLGGGVEVVTNYDYIQINATAKPDEFVTLVQTLAQAVSNPTIDRETLAALKKALSEKLTSLEKDPAYIADQAGAKRLFGTFPYGRPPMGSVETLTHIDFADLQFARERFLCADNATVTISGNFNSDLGFRAARRYFGAWLKSDKRVPFTFRQPDDPDTKPLEINVDGMTNAEVRHARRGLARNDKDFFAAQVLSKIIQSRLKALTSLENVTVSHEPRVLPGALVLNYRSAANERGLGFEWVGRIEDLEFNKARTEVAASINVAALADRWLDVDTYHLTSVSEDMKSFDQIKISDVQNVADRLSRNPQVTVLVKGR